MPDTLQGGISILSSAIMLKRKSENIKEQKVKNLKPPEIPPILIFYYKFYYLCLISLH